MNPTDVFDLACQIERRGAEFYADAAERADDPKAAQLLRQLVAMEKDHEETFLHMKQSVSDQTPAEAGDYLQAFSQDALVADLKEGPSSRMEGGEDIHLVVRTAIGMENDSILFYLGVKELLEPGNARRQVDRIIAQEMEHATSLRNLARYLQEEQEQ